MLIKPKFANLFTLLTTVFFSMLISVNTHSMNLETLSQDPQWRDLLHYHRVGINFDNGSQIDDGRFFLSSDGSQDPLSELEHTFEFFQKSKDEQLALNPDVKAAQCRFPARLVWLKNKMPDVPFIDVDCPEFNKWFDDLNGEKLYLVFPAAYLNSPSSMYGHTLFRVKKRGNNNPLLDSAVNFAANTDPNDNELVFTYKGLTGGYPGVASIMPYYQKVKEYSFLESRDIWEYELKLSQTELDQFLRHIWEVQSAHFDYYFFSENCSYQLLTLLDAAVEGPGLADSFDIWAIPVDTVRALNANGLLADTTYRPSVMNRMNYMMDELSERQVSIAKQLVESVELDLSDLEAYGNYDQTRIIEVAYEYSRYLSARKKSSLSHLSSRSIKLLSLRSKMGARSVFMDMPTPEKRDDEGHKTQRVSFGGLVRDDKGFGRLEYRPSYHDVLDPIDGYLPGAELSMLGGALRVNDEMDVELDYLNFVNIMSMSPRTALMTPKSWKVNASLIHDIRQSDELVFNLQGGVGATYTYGQGLVAVFLNASASIDNEYKHGYLTEVGPEVRWLIQGQKSSFYTGYQYWSDTKRLSDATHRFSAGVGLMMSDDLQLRGETQYIKTNQSDWLNGHVSLMYYF
ncbi:DUF4105 domain-containing protein [Marinomonas mediterranea]|jgi:hypothetical protein|uniref:Uncharacterized protein n=1 Tax=Marinomonas mediterranea (strain ATCC 700492 / JCM 21426 / NBRC 103028 / MMB-1) TaxID=717774 RepID=F2K012_MARM1|nr:DUF4105 domain-containing protein [Marinomonas mediterranea]ADZ92124.1 hypothetical protein Marme_2902 [Marinomonas mediterranea MMB-1]WCN10090.1 DUF4105 domain-containing protein [Marinomonas mediterranea]WCN18189.1 DUF4105 domain-containing protein [Marinomonas mediterranea MMB-1]